MGHRPGNGVGPVGCSTAGGRRSTAASRPACVGALGRPRQLPRPPDRPRRFPDAGLVILRSRGEDGPEIWCRCDGGPHGFLSIAAHAHADALSVEVRHDGVDILADPGTYCYHGEPAWREWFRSTAAHNTVEVGGVTQAESGGPVPVDHAAPDEDSGLRGGRSAGADLDRGARRIPAAERSDGAPPFGDARLEPDAA